jgi:hypothetical protein
MTIQQEAHAARAEIIEAMGKEIAQLSTERDMMTFIDDWYIAIYISCTFW